MVSIGTTGAASLQQLNKMWNKRLEKLKPNHLISKLKTLQRKNKTKQKNKKERKKKTPMSNISAERVYDMDSRGIGNEVLFILTKVQYPLYWKSVKEDSGYLVSLNDNNK